MDSDRVSSTFSVELDLSEHLISERVAHDEAWVSVSAAQIHQSTLGQNDDVTAVFKGISVDLLERRGDIISLFKIYIVVLNCYLWLDGDFLDGVVIEPLDVELAIEVSDVAEDGIVMHELNMRAVDDVLAASRGDKDATAWGGLLHGGDLEALHGSLQSVYGVDLGDDDARAERSERMGAALANVSVAGNDGYFARQHDVGSALDTVDKRLAAAVQVVELRLGH